MEPGVLTTSDYADMVKRRKWSLALPACLVIVITITVALLLPSTYRSSSTILIEEQEIPSDFVAATVTSFAEQRLQSIEQRIMSYSKLLEIVNQFSLYEDLKEKWTTEKIIEKMREDIQLQTISAEVMDRRTGRPSVATIAFTLSYEGRDPGKVQQVANKLTSLYLEENLKVRTRQTQEAYTFIEDEMKRVKNDLDGIEENIAVFKKAHINTLPELFQVNQQSLSNIERNVERLEEQLRTLKEREGYLETQLASIPQSEDPQKSRLKELKIQLTHLRTRFSEVHPDVIKTQAEIIKREADQSDNFESGNPGDDPPDNVAYITLASQLASTRADIDSVKEQLLDSTKQMETYRMRIEASPKVEQEYNALKSERNNTLLKYDDLMRKFMEAKIAHGLEKEQKGERFTLIDPARFPERPFKPNRLAIILIGFVLGIGTGVGSAALKEFADHSVRNSETLVRLTGFPVLGSIPEIVTRRDLARKRIKRFLWVLGVLLVMGVAVAVFHYWIMDLDVFWAKFLRKIDKELVF